MYESELIAGIKNITQSRYIGDDCAYLDELGITVSQDSLVEDVHFRLKWMRPFELGEKTALVNISDVLASRARPKYITISLSLPNTIQKDFVEEFYKGVMKSCTEYDVEVVGGDLTGSDKVFISATIIGVLNNQKATSRKASKAGYKVVVFGEHGSSAAGLRLLEHGANTPSALIEAHKRPKLCKKLPVCETPFAMMDSSDGLADALIKIANASQLSLEIDFEKIPFNPEIKIFEDYENLILFGGEDYGLIAVLPQNVETEGFVQIGSAISQQEVPLIIHKAGELLKIRSVEDSTYNHFDTTVL